MFIKLWTSIIILTFIGIKEGMQAKKRIQLINTMETETTQSQKDQKITFQNTILKTVFSVIIPEVNLERSRLKERRSKITNDSLMAYPPYLYDSNNTKDRIEELKDYELPKLPSLNPSSHYVSQLSKNRYTYHPNISLPTKLPRTFPLTIDLQFLPSKEGVSNPLASPIHSQDKQKPLPLPERKPKNQWVDWFEPLAHVRSDEIFLGLCKIRVVLPLPREHC